VGMEEWLLLDGITLDSGDIAIGDVERASEVEANLADSGLSLGNGAAVAASVAAHSIAIQLFPEGRVAFLHSVVGRQDVLERGHTSILRLFLGYGGRVLYHREHRGHRGRQNRTKDRSVRFGFCALVMGTEPHLGLLARGGNLRPGHLGG